MTPLRTTALRSTTLRTTALALAALAAAPAASSAHLHLTTTATADGSALSFTTYGDDAVTIDPTGHLLRDGLPLTYTVATPVAAGDFAGFLAGGAPTLTTDLPSFVDAYGTAANQPDVTYTIAGVTPADATGSADNVIAYVVPAGEAPYQAARSDGATAGDRSLDYGVGSHFHGVTLYSRDPGLYDLTFTSSDANGLLGPSATPLTFRVNAVAPAAVPEPATLGVVGGAALLLLRRRRAS